MGKNKLFDDYGEFVDKFKPKLTTDDCYTPSWCYDAVVEYVNAEVMPLEGYTIERPFWPGANYQEYTYTEKSVVIDNPPFSIVSQICNWLNSRGVRFFLFAPALTLGGLAKDKYTAVVYGGPVTYENGAKVPTSFVSNMYEGNPAIICSSKLNRLIDAGERKVEAKSALPKYEYPFGVTSPALLQKISKRFIDLRVERDEANFMRALESQRMQKKAIFGGGWLLKAEAAARVAAAREAAAREAAARETIYWPLSVQEYTYIHGKEPDPILHPPQGITE